MQGSVSRMTPSNRTPDPAPDLSGRVFVVTGAAGGLGLATTTALARRGAHVVLAVRDEAKGHRATAHLRAEQSGARLDVRRLDLADPDSVHAFAQRLREDGVHPDVLVNNAGVMAPPRTLTPTATNSSSPSTTSATSPSPPTSSTCSPAAATPAWSPSPPPTTAAPASTSTT